MRTVALALLLAAAPLHAEDAPLERLPAAEAGGFYDDKIHYFEQPDFVLYRQGEQRWHRHLHEALKLDPTTEISLTHRNRLETVSHLWRRGQARGARLNIPFTDSQIVERTRLRLGKQFGDFWILTELQDARLYAHDDRELDGNAVEDHFDTQQLTLSYTDRTTFGTQLRTDVHVGRFTFEYGGTRLIGRNVLPNATNTFDGLHLSTGLGTLWRGRAFLVMPVERLVREPNQSNDERLLWGTVYENNENARCLLDLGYLGFTNRLSGDRARQDTFSTFTARARIDYPRTQAQFKAMPDAGLLDYEVDAAVQNGRKGLAGFASQMLHAEAGYTFKRRWFPRLNAYYDFASGTKNPGVGKNTTFDRLFGLRDFDLGATANYGPFQRANMKSYTLKAEVRPTPDWRFFYKHALRELDEARDQFASSNLAGFAALRDPTGRAGVKLGHDFETSARRRFGENHELEVRWAHWWKGSYFDRLPASAGLPPGGAKDTDFVLCSMEFRI